MMTQVTFSTGKTRYKFRNVEDRFHDKVPDLELALGAEMKALPQSIAVARTQVINYYVDF